MEKKYPVGYGKPPAHAQFKKGKSGNPAGKPKGNKLPNKTMILTKLLSKEVILKSGGSSTKVSMQEAFFLALLKRAVDGHGPSMKLLIAEYNSIPSAYKEPAPDIFTENSTSMQMLEEIAKKVDQYALPAQSKDFKS